MDIVRQEMTSEYSLHSIKIDHWMKQSSFLSLDLKNLDVNGSVLERGNSNGTPDQVIPKVDTFEPLPSLDMFKEYKYSVDDLVLFLGHLELR